jgi:hypothetical protein
MARISGVGAPGIRATESGRSTDGPPSGRTDATEGGSALCPARGTATEGGQQAPPAPFSCSAKPNRHLCRTQTPHNLSLPRPLGVLAHVPEGPNARSA